MAPIPSLSYGTSFYSLDVVQYLHVIRLFILVRVVILKMPLLKEVR